MKVVKNVGMILGDCLVILFSYFLALLLRFDFVFSNFSEQWLKGYLVLMPFYCVVTVVIFFLFRLYHSIWAYASTQELLRLLLSYVVIIGLHVVEILFLPQRMPLSFYMMGTLVSFVLHAAERYAHRFARSVKNSYALRHAEDAQKTLIVGAGDAARTLIREIVNSDHIMRYKVVCVIDDDPEKIGKYIEGIPVVGGRGMIHETVRKYGVRIIIYAIPSASAKDRKNILDLCEGTGCVMKTLPGIYQLINEEVSVQTLRDVDFEDLLGREQVQINNDEVFGMITGKTILVTGGGGSIGSELCRQIARHKPKRLVIFDIYENNAYAIEQELKPALPELDLVVLIGSVRNNHRIRQVMNEYKPDIVYHAAAHKHVPLMEDSPNEAVKNNCLGTYKTAKAAIEAGVKKFVLISTDKAVNPVNIMGASKRICEMIVQALERSQKTTDFVAVRFGNVLGSNGSVVPLFKQQIANGGPVTVTDRRIIRYFMTIPEAVSLVLQASFYAKGGEIFVLDMGEPVSIDEMARKLIRLSGLEPDVDSEIKYTGFREGE